MDITFSAPSLDELGMKELVRAERPLVVVAENVAAFNGLTTYEHSFEEALKRLKERAAGAVLGYIVTCWQREGMISKVKCVTTVMHVELYEAII